MSLVAELKRRNVFKVAVAYAVIAWLLARVIEQTDVAWPPRSPIDWPLKNW